MDQARSNNLSHSHAMLTIEVRKIDDNRVANGAGAQCNLAAEIALRKTEDHRFTASEGVKRDNNANMVPGSKPKDIVSQVL
jgi:hypothetical protein